MQPESWEELKLKRRHKRCFHRVISGLERGGQLRLITLTSSLTAPLDIQRSFRRLGARLKRRGLVKDYIKVIELTEAGYEHVHLCFRGSYIDQIYLSHLWAEIHNSPVVDIRQVKSSYRDKVRVASYLAKYMAKEQYRRYSWSWGWVYKGFIKTWVAGKRIIAAYLTGSLKRSGFYQFLKFWKSHLRTLSPPRDFLDFLIYQTQLIATIELNKLYKGQLISLSYTV